jgi:hypothetical protein
MINSVAPHYVYEWVRPDYNEAYYVGKGSGKRAYYMFRDNDYTNCVTAKLIRNGTPTDIRIIAWFENEDAAYAYEEERIAFLKPLGFLTNDHPGGKAPPSPKGRKDSEQTRQLKSISKLGELNPMKRPVVVDKSKKGIKKFRESPEGKEFQEKHSAKLIQLYETPQGKEILRRMGNKVSAIQSAKGDAHHSKRPEVREKNRISKLGGKNPAAKEVVEINSGLKFSSATVAAEHFGIGCWIVQTSAKKTRPTKYGLRFSYICKETK